LLVKAWSASCTGCRSRDHGAGRWSGRCRKGGSMSADGSGMCWPSSAGRPEFAAHVWLPAISSPAPRPWSSSVWEGGVASIALVWRDSTDQPVAAESAQPSSLQYDFHSAVLWLADTWTGRHKEVRLTKTLD